MSDLEAENKRHRIEEVQEYMLTEIIILMETRLFSTPNIEQARRLVTEDRNNLRQKRTQRYLRKKIVDLEETLYQTRKKLEEIVECKHCGESGFIYRQHIGYENECQPVKLPCPHCTPKELLCDKCGGTGLYHERMCPKCKWTGLKGTCPT